MITYLGYVWLTIFIIFFVLKKREKNNIWFLFYFLKKNILFCFNLLIRLVYVFIKVQNYFKYYEIKYFKLIKSCSVGLLVVLKIIFYLKQDNIIFLNLKEGKKKKEI